MTIGNEPVNYIAVIGSRNFSRPELITAEIDDFHAKNPKWHLLSGGCPGKNRETSVDTVAADHARSIGMPVKELIANWDALGRGAGLIRNTEIVKQSKALIAGWDSISRGTADSLVKSWRLGRRMKVIFPNGFVTTDSLLIGKLAATARNDVDALASIDEAIQVAPFVNKLRNEVFEFLVATYQTKEK